MNYQISSRVTDTGRVLYMIYDKDETDNTSYGTCSWTIKTMAQYNYFTKSSAYKKLSQLRNEE